MNLEMLISKFLQNLSYAFVFFVSLIQVPFVYCEVCRFDSTVINESNYNFLAKDKTCLRVKSIQLDETRLRQIDFPFIEKVKESIVISGAYCADKLDLIKADKLEFVGRKIEIVYNDLVSKISFPNLKTAQELTIYSNDLVSNIYLPSLSSANIIRISWNNSLQKLSIPSLQNTELLQIQNNNMLRRIYLDKIHLKSSFNPVYFILLNNRINLDVCMHKEKINETELIFLGIDSMKNVKKCLIDHKEKYHF